MENGMQAISFKDSFLAIFPFTKQGKLSKKMLDKESRRMFWKKEQERVEYLQNLVNNHQHREALRQIVSDTTVENPIQYFNKIREEETRKSQNTVTAIAPSTKFEKTTEIGTDTDDKINQSTSSITTTLATGSKVSKKCKWSGLNSKQYEMVCTNPAIPLPRKHHNNDKYPRQTTVYMSNFCQYHQKYCIDVDQRHERAMNRIVIPNELGLCSNCYVLKVGRAPVMRDRYPGLKRKNELDFKNVQKAKPLFKKPMASLETINTCNIAEKTNSKNQKEKISPVIAAETIRRSMRRSLTKTRKSIQYERDRLENMSAVWIQSLFRYSLIKKRIRIRCATVGGNKSNDRNGGTVCLPLFYGVDDIIKDQIKMKINPNHVYK